MGALRTIVEEKEQTIHAVGPETSVLEAVDRMCQSRVGALLVVQGSMAIGILSERDIMRRLVLEQRDPARTKVAEIMTLEVLCIDADREPEEAMSLMTARRVRHLPVVEGSTVVGIISIGDLVRWASRHQDYEIRTLREYVSGVYAG
jgi:CBS domain-containing protein